MKNLPKLLLIVIATFIVVGALVHFIKMDTLAFAWILNFVLMTGALAFTESLGGNLNSGYYNEKKWESKGRIYERLGVPFFRKILGWIGWEKLNKKNFPVEKDIAVLSVLHRQTKKAELGHVIIFFIVAGFNVYVAARFGFSKAVWLLVLNVLLNVYPVFLQRYNRPRISRIIRLQTRRQVA